MTLSGKATGEMHTAFSFVVSQGFPRALVARECFCAAYWLRGFCVLCWPQQTFYVHGMHKNSQDFKTWFTWVSVCQGNRDILFKCCGHDLLL